MHSYSHLTPTLIKKFKYCIVLFQLFERLGFIIKNECKNLGVTLSLIKRLLDGDKFEFLDIIFNNIKLFDNDFIIKLLIFQKNCIPLSTSKLNQLIGNYILSVKKDEKIWDSFLSFM